jgi:hypothetical protein
LKNRLFMFVVAWLVLGAFFASDAACRNEKSGTSSLRFLTLAAGARALGMGEAFSTRSDGVVSPFWNPAALSGAPAAKISFSHTQWFQDITAEFFSSAVRAKDNVFGLSLSLGKVPGIEKREGPSVEPLALVDAHDFILSFSYARNLSENYGAGLSVKWIYEKIDISSASGWGFDVGAVMTPFHGSRSALLRNLTFGAAILDFGSEIKFKKEGYFLPTRYKAGISYSAQMERLQGAVIVAFDLVKPRDDDVKAHIGAEYGFKENFRLRLGYQLGYEKERDISFGLGTRLGKYAIDYAFLPYQSDLGDVHCVSLDIEF